MWHAVQNFLVMLYDNTGHIFHAAVANFDCVSVENLVEFVFLGEVFIDELEETFCNIGLDIFAVWRVEPYYLSFPISFPRRALSFICV